MAYSESAFGWQGAIRWASSPKRYLLNHPDPDQDGRPDGVRTPSSTGSRMPTTGARCLMFSSDRGKALTQRLNSLALSQEAFIAENYGDKATAELKRLLEGLIEKAN